MLFDGNRNVFGVCGGDLTPATWGDSLPSVIKVYQVNHATRLLARTLLAFGRVKVKNT